MNTSRFTSNTVLKYIATVHMVFLTIYTLGLRISIYATGWDLIYDSLSFLDMYRISIIGTGVLGAIFTAIYIRRNRSGFRLSSHLDLIFIVGLILWLIVTAIVNHDLGALDNLLGVIDVGVTVVTFYMVGMVLNKDELYYVIKRVILWGTIVWTTGCMISLTMYMVNYQGYFKFRGFIRISRQGIMDGRLFGCFSDPNYAALISLLMIVGIAYIYYREDNTRVERTRPNQIVHIITKGYLVTTGFIYLCYLVLSESRATYLSALITAVTLTVIFNYIRSKKEDVSLKSYFFRVISVTLCMVVVYFVLIVALQGVGYLITPDRDTDTELMRDDVSVDNISNSRFEIWKEYLEIVEDRPITGFSTRGALKYIDENYPDTYLAWKHYNPHSMLVQMLVWGGVIGFMLMICFWVRVALGFRGNLVSDGKYDATRTLMLSWVLIHLIYCVFNVGIYITPCVEAMFVWVALGYLEVESYDAEE